MKKFLITAITLCAMYVLAIALSTAHDIVRAARTNRMVGKSPM